MTVREDSFLETAVRHGLLHSDEADRIRVHATNHNQHPSDAALTLSMLESYEVEAIKLLSQPESLAPGYELLELVGCGAAGMVFKARQTAMNRIVALKTLTHNSGSASATAQARMIREAQAIAKLQHPGIVTAYDCGFMDGRFYIAMEYVDGPSLAQHLSQHGAVDESTTWNIIRSVADALSHAEEHGIVHRDIKPANLLVRSMNTTTGDICIKVADFGLARLLLDENGADALTATGMTLGTPAYVAPEQLRDTDVDQRADIYSLGATTLHLLTGIAPFSNLPPMKAVLAKINGDEGWRSELPTTISERSRQLLLDMTADDPSQRIENWKELIGRIEDAREHGGSRQDFQHQPTEEFTVSPNANESSANSLDAKTQSRSKVSTTSLARFLAMGLVVMMSIAAFGYYQFNYTDRTGSNPVAKLQPSGSPQPLFDGLTVPLLRQTGLWQVASAKDGSRVLRGATNSEIRLPLSLPSRLRQDLREPSRLELNLWLSQESQLTIAIDNQEPILRLSTNGLEWLSDDDANQSVDINAGGEPFVAHLHFDQIGDVTQVWMSGRLAGYLPAAQNITLRCETGMCDLSDIQQVSLSPEP